MKIKGLIKKIFISIVGFVKEGTKFYLESNLKSYELVTYIIKKIW